MLLFLRVYQIMGTIRGFSLLEMIVVMMILGVIMSAGAILLNAGFTNYFTGVKVTALTSQANIAMMKMTKELQKADKIIAINQPSPSVTFTIPTSTGATTIIYSLSGQILQRTEGSSVQTLTNQVASFSLNFYSSSVTPALYPITTDPALAKAVTISMTLNNNNEQVPLINTIFLYNL